MTPEFMLFLFAMFFFGGFIAGTQFGYHYYDEKMREFYRKNKL